jgi:hypothetical protein
MNKSKQGVITFGLAGVLAIPNELGTDANKFFDHGLSKKEKKKKEHRYEKKHDGTKEQIKKI